MLISVNINMIKYPKISNVAKANYQYQDLITAVDTDLRITECKLNCSVILRT